MRFTYTEELYSSDVEPIESDSDVGFFENIKLSTR